MPDAFWLLLFITALAIGFGFVNGLNDAANAVAATIGCRALSPRQAVSLAAVFNMAGAATGLAVARTIGKGILVAEAVSYETLVAALASVIIWGALASYWGLPVSITHGFVAALATAGIAIQGSQAVIWTVLGRVSLKRYSPPPSSALLAPLL